jgi:hypothetical protein
MQIILPKVLTGRLVALQSSVSRHTLLSGSMNNPRADEQRLLVLVLGGITFGTAQERFFRQFHSAADCINCLQSEDGNLAFRMNGLREMQTAALLTALT